MKPIVNNPVYVKRNDRCPCHSGKKFKACCANSAKARPREPYGASVSYIDDGAAPVRWVICNPAGTSFFVDATGQILVFNDKSVAFSVATLPMFESQEPGEINVAGVGEAKFATLREKLPYVEVPDVETAVQLITARIEQQQPTVAPSSEAPT